MASQSLLFYEISVKRHHQSDELILTNFDGNNLLEILEEFLQYHVNIIYGNQSSKQALGVEYIDEENRKLYERNGQYLKGYISKGDFGIKAPIKNIEDNSNPYTKKKKDAEMIPLYFCTRIRSGYTRAIFIIHSMGKHSAKSLFVESLRNFFTRNYPDFNIHFNTIVPNDLLDSFIEQGFVKKFRFIRNTVPDDITYVTDEQEEEKRIVGEAELIIKIAEGAFYKKNKLKESLRSDKLEFIRLENFEYNRAKVEINLNGKPKVIDLGKKDKIAPRMDITDSIVLGDNGFPTFASIDEVATEFLDSLTEEA